MLVDTPRSNDQANHLRVVKYCYELALLRARERMGVRLNGADQMRLESLSQLLEGDPRGKRRRHQRFPLMLPAAVRASTGAFRGTLLNMGGNGMYIASDQLLPEGAQIQIRLGSPDEVEYTFPCTVRWVTRNGSSMGMGLCFNGVPLEVRRGVTLRACA